MHPQWNLSYFAESEAITAFRCLGLFLRTKKRGEISSIDTEDIPFLMHQAVVSVFI